MRSNLIAIWSIHYTFDGCGGSRDSRLCVCLHVDDVKSECEKEKEIGFFGEIANISFSPDTELLFILLMLFSSNMVDIGSSLVYDCGYICPPNVDVEVLNMNWKTSHISNNITSQNANLFNSEMFNLVLCWNSPALLQDIMPQSSYLKI